MFTLCNMYILYYIILYCIYWYSDSCEVYLLNSSNRSCSHFSNIIDTPLRFMMCVVYLCILYVIMYVVYRGLGVETDYVH